MLGRHVPIIRFGSARESGNDKCDDVRFNNSLQSATIKTGKKERWVKFGPASPFVVMLGKTLCLSLPNCINPEGKAWFSLATQA